MMPSVAHSLTAKLGSAATYLREAHLLRGAVYLGLGALTLQSFAPFFPRRKPYGMELLHLSVLPFTLAVTRAFAELRPEDRAAWKTVELRQGVRDAAVGAALGATSLLGILSIALAQGWLSAPDWGWRTEGTRRVATSIALITVGQLAVAWNEELVFRGYGSTTLRKVLPEAVAEGLLVALFALAHPINPRTLIGEAALGLVLVELRRRSAHIWMPLGFHWGWNVLQSAVFGPAERRPSLRPLYVHGPPLWIGHPGYPDPGVLTILVCLGLAAVLHALPSRQAEP
jgi:membrane protease YdiL (CAAX protease family)